MKVDREKMKSRMSQGGRGQGQESVLERERLKGNKSRKKEKERCMLKEQQIAEWHNCMIKTDYKPFILCLESRQATIHN